MKADNAEDRNLSMAKEYFIRGEPGRADILELFQSGVSALFPKLASSVAASFHGVAFGFGRHAQVHRADFSKYNFIVTGAYVVVEARRAAR